jgi:5'-3' exonuclease
LASKFVSVIIHLVDGTYELHRQFYGRYLRASDSHPQEAVIGTLTGVLKLVEDGATHICVATDHVIESFRNNLWPDYKTSEGMEPEILRQIPELEHALRAMGITVWAMEDFEADDALASGVRVACDDRRVHKVRILTPDKDLSQCVRGRRVVQVDSRNNVELDETAVKKKYGVGPQSIVDYLALVGDTSDGYPGLPGWGAKSASTVLARYEHIMSIPTSFDQWAKDGVKIRGGEKLAAVLRDRRADAELFRTLATLVDTVDVGEVDDWKWRGPTEEFHSLVKSWGVERLAERVMTLV